MSPDGASGTPHSTGPLPRRTVLQGAALLGGAVLLAACGDDQGSTPAGGAAITVTDQRGKKVTFDKPVTRVVTLPNPAASLLLAVDRTASHLVGMHEASWTAMHDGILGTMFPDALDVPHDLASDEFMPNVESIVALEPDVVVQWGDHGDAIVTPLENAGLDVLGLSYGTQEDLTTWVDLFATMLGKPDRGKGINDRIASEQDRMQALGDSRSSSPRVMYFWQVLEGIEVAGKESYNDFYIDLVGATNPAREATAPQGIVSVDIEQVLAWDPEIVLIGNFEDTMPADVYDSDVWQSVTAVRSRRVYKVPLGGYRWDPPGQESPLMWRWLSAVAFPGEQSGFREEIRSYYRFLYNYTPTDPQIDQILWTEANRGSADYRQFDAG